MVDARTNRKTRTPSQLAPKPETRCSSVLEGSTARGFQWIPRFTADSGVLMRRDEGRGTRAERKVTTVMSTSPATPAGSTRKTFTSGSAVDVRSAGGSDENDMMSMSVASRRTGELN